MGDDVSIAETARAAPRIADGSPREDIKPGSLYLDHTGIGALNQEIAPRQRRMFALGDWRYLAAISLAIAESIRLQQRLNISPEMVAVLASLAYGEVRQ